MLYKQTVSSATLELLKRLINDPSLTDFFLVGGTALSLQIGHRISIDLDFFTTSEFDQIALMDTLEANYGLVTDSYEKNTLKGKIEGIKVDLITHKYGLLSPLIEIDGIRMAGLQDIAAMKMNAITRSGTRVKDFIDIAYLSSKMSAIEIMECCLKKYPNHNPLMAIKSLLYHEDIDFSEPIEIIDSDYQWSFVEQRLKDMVNQPERIFNHLSYSNDTNIEQSKGNRPRLGR